MTENSTKMMVGKRRLISCPKNALAFILKFKSPEDLMEFTDSVLYQQIKALHNQIPLEMNGRCESKEYMNKTDPSEKVREMLDEIDKTIAEEEQKRAALKASMKKIEMELAKLD